MSIILGKNSAGKYCVATVNMADKASVRVDNVQYITECSWTIPFTPECRGIITSILHNCGVGGKIAGHFLANVPPEHAETLKTAIGCVAAALSLARIGGAVVPTTQKTVYESIEKVPLGAAWTISVSPRSRPVTVTHT